MSVAGQRAVAPPVTRGGEESIHPTSGGRRRAGSAEPFPSVASRTGAAESKNRPGAAEPKVTGGGEKGEGGGMERAAVPRPGKRPAERMRRDKPDPAWTSVGDVKGGVGEGPSEIAAGRMADGPDSRRTGKERAATSEKGRLPSESVGTTEGQVLSFEISREGTALPAGSPEGGDARGATPSAISDTEVGGEKVLGDGLPPGDEKHPPTQGVDRGAKDDGRMEESPSPDPVEIIDWFLGSRS